MTKKQILIVEDENIVALDIQQSLLKLGYSVLGICNNAEDAISSVKSITPDLILMDIKIKGKRDGIEAAEEIWGNSHVPIIFLTAFADEMTLERAKLAEPFGYVLKPFEEDELRTTIEVALKKSSSINEKELSQQRALEESEEHFRVLVESVKDYGIITLDHSGRVRSWNAGAENISGHAIAEVTGRHFSMFYSTKDDREAREHANEHLRLASLHERFHEETWLYKKSGHRYWAHVTINTLFDKEKNVRGFALIIRDMSERKIFEDTLQSTRDLLQSILDNAPAIIYVKDPEGRYLHVNKGFTQFIKRSREEVLGKTDLNFFPEDDAEKYRSNDEKVWQDKAPLQIEEQSNEEGRPHTYFSIKFPVFDTYGRPFAIGGISTDITDRKQDELQRIHLVQKLQEALKTREDFISLASHELKTPITSIKLQNQTLLRDLGKNKSESVDSNKVQKALVLSTEQLNRLNSLVDDMLDISKINADHFAVEKELFDLNDLVREVLEKCKGALSRAGITVQLRLKKDVIGMWDREKMGKVVSHLLSNVIKFAPGKPVEITLKKKTGTAVFSIRDHGVGIRKDAQDMIFRRFERAIGTINISGLGLGLYISDYIVKLHGGKIDLQSELGRGTLFTIHLPLNHALVQVAPQNLTVTETRNNPEL